MASAGIGLGSVGRLGRGFAAASSGFSSPRPGRAPRRLRRGGSEPHARRASPRGALESAARLHVAVEACGLSLRRAGMQESELYWSVRVVPNGLVEVMRLEQRGFVAVTL